LRLSDFDYRLPVDLIAQEPLADRAASRMLVVDRATGKWEDRMFREFPSLLLEGDCVVLNDTKVFPARMFGHRKGFAGHVEVFLVRPLPEGNWLCLVRPGRKIRTGDRIVFGDLECAVIGRNEHGERIVRFHHEGDLYEAFERTGHVPLPPYIKRKDRVEDRDRYQTVFARERGSVAAPTAGLHFTPEILARIPNIKRVTLHVGLGTFQPLHSEQLEDVKLHSEWYRVPETIAAKRVVAVGTTTVRTLETTGGQAGEGETSLFIAPGYQFKIVGAMLTNFHLPKSSLFVLVCAFGGRELMLGAYEHAIRERYRFYSYGDCMLVV
jgi:S-adenosylmethionine:tRNA ribosyltransferase-isomerase